MARHVLEVEWVGPLEKIEEILQGAGHIILEQDLCHEITLVEAENDASDLRKITFTAGGKSIRAVRDRMDVLMEFLGQWEENEAQV